MNNKLLRFKKKLKFIIFDYETCGLNLCSLDNKPWQLAFMVCEGDKVIDSYDFYLKWDSLPISEDAKRVTNFNEKKYLKEALDPRQCLDIFEKYFFNNDYLIVGHNIIGFDIYIHNIHRRLCGLPTDYSFLDRLIDTNCLAKSLMLDIQFDEDNLLLWQFKLSDIRKKGVKTNLKSLCEKFQIDFDPSKLHNALYDIEKNREVFQKLIWQVKV